MEQTIPLTLIFFTGFFSFISPCILPFIPPYLGYLTGVSLKKNYSRVRSFFDSFFFILGFSLIFIILGATASFLGQFLNPYKLILQKIGGLIIILFGLQIFGLFSFFKWINFSLGFRFIKASIPFLTKISYFRSFLIGSIFAFGWIACIGPILASILVLVSLQETLNQGLLFLIVYLSGLAIPFLVISLFWPTLTQSLQKIRFLMPLLPIVSGGLLIILGLLFFTDYFYLVVSWLYRWYNQIGIPIW